MKWYGLNWLDIILNTCALAIIPLLIAAIGGHFAAQDVPDFRRRRKMKYWFWALFVSGVLATLWQQFRAAEADQERSTKDTWAEVLFDSKFPPPPAPVYVEPGKVQQPLRSYLAFDGSFRFPERKDSNGQVVPDQHLQVGDDLGFNVYYKDTGPKPIELIEAARWLYLKSDSNVPTQGNLIADFKHRLFEESRTFHPGEPATLMPGDGAGRFLTVYAADGESHRKVTAEDLAQLQTGAEVAFVIVEFTYRDNRAIHHTRECAWLQPPADPPGVWHACDGFNQSD